MCVEGCASLQKKPPVPSRAPGVRDLPPSFWPLARPNRSETRDLLTDDGLLARRSPIALPAAILVRPLENSASPEGAGPIPLEQSPQFVAESGDTVMVLDVS